MPGRKELPLLPDGTARTDLAIQLRNLRQRSGLTYDELAAETHFGKTTLREACSGRVIPSLEVLEAFLKGCGAELNDEWTLMLAAASQRHPSHRLPPVEVRDIPDGAMPGTSNRPLGPAQRTDDRIEVAPTDTDEGVGAQSIPTATQPDQMTEHERPFALRRRRSMALVGVTFAGLVVLVLLLTRTGSTTTISGTVRCASGANLVGVWIETGEEETSGFAKLDGIQQGLGHYRALVPLKTAYSIHAGCGGDQTDWKVRGYSDWTTETVTAWVCHDTSPRAAAPPYHTDCTSTTG